MLGVARRAARSIEVFDRCLSLQLRASINNFQRNDSGQVVAIDSQIDPEVWYSGFSVRLESRGFRHRDSHRSYNLPAAANNECLARRIRCDKHLVWVAPA